jgi:hypothetical protein
VQRIKNDFTCVVYEIHGRIALEKVRVAKFLDWCSGLTLIPRLRTLPFFFRRRYCSPFLASFHSPSLVILRPRHSLQGDLGEFNQCQGQLRELYKHGLPGHVMEFLGYRILYLLFSKNRAGG